MNSLDVIGAGLGRTGTLSLKLALEQLGFGPCHHMLELFRAPGRASAWEAAWSGDTAAWADALAGFRSTVDWPGALLYGELADLHPEARVILTVRDADAWYESCARTIFSRRLPLTSSVHSSSFDAVVGLNTRMIWEGMFDGRFADRLQAKREFERHNREVRERIPEDRLLVYDVRDGWEPLCRFLGVDVPLRTPFPRVNTAEVWKPNRD